MTTTYSHMWAAGCEYWQWSLAPTDDTGDPIDPTSLPVAFAAVDTALGPANTWAGIVVQAEDSGAGDWQGPDQAGYYTARILVSGPGGGGTLEVPVGTWRMMAQITSTPERPVEETGRLVLR